MKAFLLSAKSWSIPKLLGFLLLVVTAAWVPAALKAGAGFGRFADKMKAEALASFPAISIVEGQVSVDPPGRHAVKDPDTGKDLLVIDLSRTAADAAGIDGNLLLLTKSQLIVRRQRRRDTRIYDLNGWNFQVDAARIAGWLDAGKPLIPAVMFAVGATTSFFFRLLQALFYAALGLLFARGLTYSPLVRLAVVAAVAPVILLNAAKNTLGLQVPFWSPICFALALSLLWLAVKTVAEPAAPQAAPA